MVGIREVLSWVKGKQWQNVEMESDSLQVIQALNGLHFQDLLSFGLIALDCKSLLNKISFVIRFIHALRSGNRFDLTVVS